MNRTVLYKDVKIMYALGKKKSKKKIEVKNKANSSFFSLRFIIRRVVSEYDFSFFIVPCEIISYI